MSIFDVSVSLSGSAQGWSLEDWRNLAIIVLGGIGVWLGWRRNLTAEKQAQAATDQIEIANQQIKIASQQIEIANQNVTLSERTADMDRFQKGAQMLGDPRLSVRQAGVIIFDELARENPKRFALMCQKTLEQFILDRGREDTKDFDDLFDENTPNISDDAQSALDVVVDISQMKGKRGETYGKKVELPKAHLKGAWLQKANLQGAELRHANLQGAVLWRANLQGAELWSANLQGAELRHANLQGAWLRHANLQGAWLRHANLQGARLGNANLHGADLRGVDLHGADLEDAKVTWEQLDQAKNVGQAKNLPPRNSDEG